LNLPLEDAYLEQHAWLNCPSELRRHNEAAVLRHYAVVPALDIAAPGLRAAPQISLENVVEVL
jgi:hypothetical protein